MNIMYLRDLKPGKVYRNWCDWLLLVLKQEFRENGASCISFLWLTGFYKEKIEKWKYEGFERIEVEEGLL